jgi:DNA-binding CsgD family transcriptional regulator/PAS domain-containing protein
VAEIACVVGGMSGFVNFSNAIRPFQWLSSGKEYLVCSLRNRSRGRLVLFMRARCSQSANWARISATALRIQRLLDIALELAPTKPPLQPSKELIELSARSLAELCPFGIVIVDLDQRILLTNAAAGELFGTSMLVGEAAGRLAILQPDYAVRFQIALRAVLSAPDGSDARHAVAIVGPDRSTLLLQIVRMPSQLERNCACVMITEPSLSSKINIQPLADAFGLTRVQTRLVGQLVMGRSIQEAAQALHLKVETTRTYLKQIFEKTDTHRQVELVMLMQNGEIPSLGRRNSEREFDIFVHLTDCSTLL